MEKRSRRRIRDLVALAAFQGLSQNEIGCARISMMARSTNAPFKGRIQKRKTNDLHLLTFGLHRTAGPYKRAQEPKLRVVLRWGKSGKTMTVIAQAPRGGHRRPQLFASKAGTGDGVLSRAAVDSRCD